MAAANHLAVDNPLEHGLRVLPEQVVDPDRPVFLVDHPEGLFARGPKPERQGDVVPVEQDRIFVDEHVGAVEAILTADAPVRRHLSSNPAHREVVVEKTGWHIARQRRRLDVAHEEEDDALGFPRREGRNLASADRVALR